MARFWRWLKDANGQEGQSLVEYSLILCLVIVILIVLLMLMGNQVKNLYCNISGGVGA